MFSGIECTVIALKLSHYYKMHYSPPEVQFLKEIIPRKKPEKSHEREDLRRGGQQ
jgi:hypothetical protein